MTTPLTIGLSGRQPTKPATITATLRQALPSGAVVRLITQHTPGGPVTAEPATYDPSTRTVTASITHFSLAFFAMIDIRPVLDEITKTFTSTFGLSRERPGCSGKPLVTGATTYTLPSRYLDKGDGILWPCLIERNGKVVVGLAAASGLPYLVRVSPKAELTYGGTVDIGKAAVLAGYRQLVVHPPYTQGLLVPGSSISYAFDGSKLPGLIQAKLDLGTHLALTAIWAAQFVLTVFDIRVVLLEKAEVLNCIGDVVEAATPPDKPLSGSAIGAVLKSMFSCAASVIRAMGGIVTGIVGVVLSALSGGVGIAAAGLQGAWQTAMRHDLTSVQVGRVTDATLADSPFTGKWWVHGGSLIVRADATATIRYRHGFCGPDLAEDCYSDQDLTVRVSPDGRTATMTIRMVRYIAYRNGTPHALTHPDPDMVASTEPVGTVFRFRFTAPGLIKNIDRDENLGNPYFCDVDHPPADAHECGA